MNPSELYEAQNKILTQSNQENDNNFLREPKKNFELITDAGINQDTETDDYGLSVMGEEIGPEFCNIL